MRHPFYPGLKPAPANGAGALVSALSGTYAELIHASDAGVQVARAVFPLHNQASPFLASGEREALWSMFEVPVLALLLNDRGAVIGYECELQEGYHLKDEAADGLPAGRIESSLCECGRPGPRLMPPEEELMPMLESRSAAAD
jgi:hypothetical protein